jgi:hypothetical protein
MQAIIIELRIPRQFPLNLNYFTSKLNLIESKSTTLKTNSISLIMWGKFIIKIN